jgi:hypothetical protein
VSDDEKQPKPEPRRHDRRAFIGGALAAGAGALVAGTGAAPEKGPKELPLEDADLYGPHDLAG